MTTTTLAAVIRKADSDRADFDSLATAYRAVAGKSVALAFRLAAWGKIDGLKPVQIKDAVRGDDADVNLSTLSTVCSALSKLYSAQPEDREARQAWLLAVAEGRCTRCAVTGSANACTDAQGKVSHHTIRVSDAYARTSTPAESVAPQTDDTSTDPAPRPTAAEAKGDDLATAEANYLAALARATRADARTSFMRVQATLIQRGTAVRKAPANA